MPWPAAPEHGALHPDFSAFLEFLVLLVAMAACISEFLAVAAAAAMVESLAACLEFLMLHVAVVAVASMGDGFAASREFLVLYVSLATVAATDEVLCCISGVPRAAHRRGCSGRHGRTPCYIPGVPRAARRCGRRGCQTMPSAASREFLVLHVAVVAVAAMGKGLAASLVFLVLHVAVACLAAKDDGGALGSCHPVACRSFAACSAACALSQALPMVL